MRNNGPSDACSLPPVRQTGGSGQGGLREVVVSMAVKVLCAGCPKEEREEAEATVRRVLGKRAESGAWTVSLVRMADMWSVTLDGPSVRALNFVAPGDKLGETIAGALGKPPAPAHAPAPAAHPRASEPGNSYQCEKCRRAFVVIFESTAGEGRQNAPAACPHCWHVNQVLVGERAAEMRDYRAEKA